MLAAQVLFCCLRVLAPCLCDFLPLRGIGSSPASSDTTDDVLEIVEPLSHELSCWPNTMQVQSRSKDGALGSRRRGNMLQMHLFSATFGCRSKDVKTMFEASLHLCRRMRSRW